MQFLDVIPKKIVVFFLLVISFCQIGIAGDSCSDTMERVSTLFHNIKTTDLPRKIKKQVFKGLQRCGQNCSAKELERMEKIFEDALPKRSKTKKSPNTSSQTKAPSLNPVPHKESFTQRITSADEQLKLRTLDENATDNLRIRTRLVDRPDFERKVQEIDRKRTTAKAKAQTERDSSEIKVKSRHWHLRRRREKASTRLAHSHKNFKNISQLEEYFDVLARKVFSLKPTYNGNAVVNEVDSAFAFAGRPRGYISVDKNDQLRVQYRDVEQVYAVGSQGAKNFLPQNKDLDYRSGSRFYALLFPKGFITKYGDELGRKNVDLESFSEESMHKQGKILPIRKEKATSAQGQVHIGTFDEFQHLNIWGRHMSQGEFIDENSIGVAEFDSGGELLRILVTPK